MPVFLQCLVFRDTEIDQQSHKLWRFFAPIAEMTLTERDCWPSAQTTQATGYMESFGFRVHLYADDTQFHDSCKSTDAAELAARAMRVIEAVRDWMSSKPAQTERRQDTVHLAQNKPLFGRSSDQFHSRK